MSRRLIYVAKKKPAALPIKAVLQSTSGGVTQYFIGCDRPEPLPFFTLPEDEANTATVVIRSTGIGLDDWLVTIRTQEFGDPQKLYLINPSGSTAITAPNLDTSFECFGSWAVQTIISGNFFITPSPDDSGSSTLDLTAYSTVTRSQTTTASITSSWSRDSIGAVTANYEDLAWLSPSSFQVTASGPINLASSVSFVSPSTVAMHWNPTGNTRYGSPPFLQRTAPFAAANRQGSLFNGEEYSDFFSTALLEGTANVAGNSFYSFNLPFSTGQEIETENILRIIFEGGTVTEEEIPDVEFFGFDPSIYGSSAVAATYFPP